MLRFRSRLAFLIKLGNAENEPVNHYALGFFAAFDKLEDFSENESGDSDTGSFVILSQLSKVKSS